MIVAVLRRLGRPRTPEPGTRVFDNFGRTIKNQSILVGQGESVSRFARDPDASGAGPGASDGDCACCTVHIVHMQCMGIIFPRVHEQTRMCMQNSPLKMNLYAHCTSFCEMKCAEPSRSRVACSVLPREERRLLGHSCRSLPREERNGVCLTYEWQPERSDCVHGR